MSNNPFNKNKFFSQATEVSFADLATLQSCLVLAPHPDDESLGCGGLIALLRGKGVNVTVILTTDGSQSHPNSKSFPPEKVALIRKEEVLKALAVLGVSQTNVIFFEGKDASLPHKNQSGFQILVDKLSVVIKEKEPQLILVPYELDPHCDHRATWQILQVATQNHSALKIWQYPIWLYELATEQDIPTLKYGELKKINIAPFLQVKKNAIASHVSQTTRLIDDDPTGFMLTEEVIAHFTGNFEYYIEKS